MIEQALISFFERAAQKDKAILAMLEQQGRFDVAAERWLFTLPDLFACLQTLDDAFADIEYGRFRQILFGAPLNRIVKSYDAQIIIADNQAKVNKTVYALVWRR